MSTEVDIQSIESYKPSTKVPKSFSRQKELVSGISVQPRPKLKFNRPKSRLKFEYFDHAHSNQDLTTEIQSEQLNQKH